MDKYTFYVNNWSISVKINRNRWDFSIFIKKYVFFVEQIIIPTHPFAFWRSHFVCVFYSIPTYIRHFHLKNKTTWETGEIDSFVVYRFSCYNSVTQPILRHINKLHIWFIQVQIYNTIYDHTQIGSNLGSNYIFNS